MKVKSDDIALVEGNNELNVEMTPVAPPVPPELYQWTRAMEVRDATPVQWHTEWEDGTKSGWKNLVGCIDGNASTWALARLLGREKLEARLRFSFTPGTFVGVDWRIWATGRIGIVIRAITPEGKSVPIVGGYPPGSPVFFPEPIDIEDILVRCITTVKEEIEVYCSDLMLAKKT